jgi:Tol biopolymer transport system component
VLRYAGGFCGVLLALAIPGAKTVSAASVPAGPRLALVKNTLFPFRFDLETVDEVGALPLRLAGGGERKRPLPEEFTPPSWSPDGSMIVFVGLARSIDLGLRGIRLYVSAADGDELRPLRGTHGADEPKFGPDNNTVFFTRYRFRPHLNRHGKEEFVARGASIWSIDVSGGPPKRITPGRNGVWMYPSSFSPDGSTLLATRIAGRGPWKVVKIDLATGKTEVLLRRAVEPVYSPDGTRIAFVRSRRLDPGEGAGEWTSNLFTIRAGGGDLRQITDSPWQDYSQSWDPSGERLAFVRYPPEADELGYDSAVMQVNADGTCPSTLLPASFNTAFFGVAWQPGPGREAGRIAC